MGQFITRHRIAPDHDSAGNLCSVTDHLSGETALKEVVRLFRNETKEWIHLTVNGEKITCTPEHPFYSPIKGWTNAIDLRAGDILVMLNGEYVVVEQAHNFAAKVSGVTMIITFVPSTLVSFGDQWLSEVHSIYEHSFHVDLGRSLEEEKNNRPIVYYVSQFFGWVNILSSVTFIN